MKLQFFFDYACPYCYKGYQDLLNLLAITPDLEIEWIPCEAHPRPETHGLHSDYCARGMYQAAAQGADLIKYHDIMYQACILDHVNIEDLEVIADLVRDLIDRDAFYEALQNGMYQDKLDANNHKTWNTEGFPAVPSLKAEERTLPAVPGIGLTLDQMKRFLA